MRSKFQVVAALFISLLMIVWGIYVLLVDESISPGEEILLGVTPIVVAVIGGLLLLGGASIYSAVWYWLEAIMISGIMIFLLKKADIYWSNWHEYIYFGRVPQLISFVVAADEITHYRENKNKYSKFEEINT